jgi:hypothetical protein
MTPPENKNAWPRVHPGTGKNYHQTMRTIIPRNAFFKAVAVVSPPQTRDRGDALGHIN